MGGMTLSVTALLIFFAAGILSAQQPERTAWESLTRENADLADALSPWERELLRSLTVDQLDAYLRGADPSRIVLAHGGTLETFLAKGGDGSTFELTWFTVDGGGNRSADGDLFSVSGSAGQPDAGLMTGTDRDLRGGFWAFLGARLQGTCSSPDAVFCDGFESGNLIGWSSSIDL